MKARAVAALSLCFAACHGDPAALLASDVSILAPIPGQDRTVAYLTIENRSSLPVTLEHVTSPQFATAEMHTTIVDGDMTGMQAVDSITIAEESSLRFAAGERHVMLIGPAASLRAGDVVTLEFKLDRPGTLVVQAPLQSRMPDAGE